MYIPTPIQVRMAEDCHIMGNFEKTQAQVNEKAFVEHHKLNVHTIHIYPGH